uniref:Phosphoglucomutase n=1 Tax=Strongyloides papillosus TaxID=174720 RepID=A0A0N5BDB4_STREA
MSLSFLPDDIGKQTKFYLDNERNPHNLQRINELIESKDVKSLSKCMGKKLAFGTGGIRGPIDCGMSYMNDLTYIQITSAFAMYIKKILPREKWSVVIGYDGRHNSEKWSKYVANVFIKNNIKVYMFSKVVPTPLVSYGIINFKAGAGVMITASHNPKEDNGYKAYLSNGAQLIEPNDREIEKEIEKNIPPNDNYWDVTCLENESLYNSADQSIENYYEEEKQLSYYRDKNSSCPLKFTYSSFHGVGRDYFIRMLETFGFSRSNIVEVVEQCKIDPNFSTLKKPNPEEGEHVLKLSIDTANNNQSGIIMANDPDADRLQVAEKQKDGSWYIFTGNEMGAIITWWVWRNYKKRNRDKDFKNVYMLNSVVSSQISRSISKIEGFSHEVTLTGFKWMGNTAYQLRSKGHEVILAWEESIGYLAGHSLDKDGITSGGIFAEIAAYLHRKNKLLKDKLHEIYKKYGYHLNRNSYFTIDDMMITKKLFSDIRGNKDYPKVIGKRRIKFVRDLTIGYDTEQERHKPVLPSSPSMEMITFTLENGSTVTLRASGTEPKIKYYIEYITEPGKGNEDLQSIKSELNKLENDVIKELLQPERYGLKWR